MGLKPVQPTLNGPWHAFMKRMTIDDPIQFSGRLFQIIFFYDKVFFPLDTSRLDVLRQYIVEVEFFLEFIFVHCK